jgi:hypothetical protein
MSDESYVGAGGKAREKNIMSQVDDAVGGPKHPAATPTNPTTTRRAPAPASSFAPSDDKGPRVYGSPIEGNEASK